MIDRIGFIQGRLSPMVNNKIQAFPWDHWRHEFLISSELNIRLIEWTLDQDRLYENPLMNQDGQAEIRNLCNSYGIKIPSLTGDCFMQAPFWKNAGAARRELEKDFLAITKSCSEIGISILVVPLVDNGRLGSDLEEDELINFMKSQENFFLLNKIKIAFESDYTPIKLGRFIKRLNSNVFGVNYDIGNSAALGFDPMEEFDEYGKRIVNVHIKDRLLDGTTVALGLGNAKFEVVFAELARYNYKGNYILQTARATEEQHAKVLSVYRNQVITWHQNHAS